MTLKEFKQLYILRDGITFTPDATWGSETPIKDEQGNIIDYELVGYVQIKTAEEVYRKYLEDKENPPMPQPTPLEQAQSDIQKNESLTLLYSALLKDNQDDLLSEIEALKSQIAILKGVQ